MRRENLHCAVCVTEHWGQREKQRKEGRNAKMMIETTKNKKFSTQKETFGGEYIVRRCSCRSTIVVVVVFDVAALAVRKEHTPTSDGIIPRVRRGTRHRHGRHEP